MNRHFLIKLLCILTLGSTVNLIAQDIPVNTWRSHLNYTQTNSITLTDNEAICGSQNALFSLDRTDGIITTITKEDGLSDANILSIGYSDISDQVIVLYANGNIDFISDSDIVNMRTVLNSDYPNKSFFGFRMDKQFMYICASFGVVKVNTTNYIIEETYDFIGQGGSEMNVYDITFSNDSLYIACAEGIKSVGDDANTNKQDYNNWKNVVTSTANEINTVLFSDDKVYYTVASPKEINAYRPNGISSIGNYTDEESFLLDFWGDNISLPATNKIYLIDTNDQLSEYQNEKVPTPKQVIDDTDGNAWIADATNGMVKVSSSIETFAPSGPLFSTAHDMINAENFIFMTPSDESGINVGSFAVFNNGIWENYSSLVRSDVTTIPNLPRFKGMAFMPQEQKVYFGTEGEGLFAFHIYEKTFEIIKDPFLVNGRTEATIESLSFDQFGNLWTTTDSYLHFRNPAAEWQHFLDRKITGAATETQNSFQGDAWLLVSGDRLLVFKDGNSRYLSTDQTNGGLPSNTVLSLQIDNAGSMWMGTDDGTAEYFGTAPTEAGEFSVSLPRYDGFPLLKGERVQSIAVDGGNRKWLGTVRGLWLFSSDGGRLFQQFTTENSSLLSNDIKDIAIQPTSGEVFINTSDGIVSYRSDATQGSTKFENVKIFPSPVRPEYQGVLTISGLAVNADVRITDTAGQIVWNGASYGGSTSWNLRLNNGSKPSTGVYFVFSTDQEGAEKYVGKFAIVR
ncbi:hypothetical protein KMW28_16500 [Flammeovirga yaeyamensis]|uniref:PorZ N-terminal beta-propeller domain-containing protein n=1 Tax=Flammeovirga yaeyamensis TaxID=367791 RepID=A0AAX1N0Y2_9BACT|nr:two-component regulator propeller domain-containing protein [Flammeovirga yaeyamensis]MBB3698388.1 streptogramin lyase [Flammeovirga yaeyamensis]NMF34261.1 hypothetical protein [Flammeovirga yaeyamensis]QWG01244.1 hypothetical protein KMW28_16500 [Flammeovirga yaeyamensis]